MIVLQPNDDFLFTHIRLFSRRTQFEDTHIQIQAHGATLFCPSYEKTCGKQVTSSKNRGGALGDKKRKKKLGSTAASASLVKVHARDRLGEINQCSLITATDRAVLHFATALGDGM